MDVLINGEQHRLAEGMDLAALVESLAMKSDRVAVELNGRIISREAWAQTRLQAGDTLEIVHFVGGGAA